MLSVTCVLRSGGDYTPHHVDQLRAGVTRHLSIPHRFVCLSDMEVDCERIPLKHRWPGWFSKIELFRGGIFDGAVVYFDLDTLIVGTFDDIVLGHRFTVLQNFWADSYNDPNRIGSGLMAWDADLSPIYEAFLKAPSRFVSVYKTKDRWGDQGFIKDYTPIEPERWQRKHSGRIVSFKKHVLKNRGVPAGASVVCFHGRPRPFSLPAHQRAWFDECSIPSGLRLSTA